MRAISTTHISESYFEHQKTGKNSITAHEYNYSPTQCVGSVCRGCRCLPVPLMLMIDVPRSLFLVSGSFKTLLLMDTQQVKKPSIALEEFMNVNHIQNLEELLTLSDEAIVELPGFGWNLLKEILLLRKVQ